MNLLIVDDELTNKSILKYALVHYEQANIFEVDSGQSAINYVRENDVDIVFIDLKTSIVDSVETSRAIRAINNNCLIVIIAASYDISICYSVLKADADDYISKPIAPEIIKARIKNYIKVIENRKLSEYDARPINAFGQPCLPFYTAFKIASERELAYFWEYMAEAHINSCELGKDCYVNKAVNAIFGIGVKLSKLLEKFLLIVEKSETNYYFTITKTNEIDIGLTEAMLSRACSSSAGRLSCIVKKDAISIEAPLRANIGYKQSAVAPNIKTTDVKAEIKDLQTFDFMENSDIVELTDCLTDLESSLSILAYSELTPQEVLQISDAIEKISSILSGYNETYDIASALKTLSVDVSENITILVEKSKKISKLFSSFIENLKEWKDALFVTGAVSSDFMDATIIADAYTIANMIKPSKAVESEDMDDIFSF